MQYLFDQFKVSNENKDQIKSWYNGYRVPNFESEEYEDKYNIWSVANYLSNPKAGFKSYWA